MERMGAEEEESSFMELLDSELLPFAAATRSPSSSSITTTITCSNNSYSTAEEAITDDIRRSSKKQKRSGGPASSLGTIKVRKDKLGDRIAALQQLVSPYGKSDTASVLHESLGYIRFLHDQVQVLSSPYLLHRQPTAATASMQEYCESSGEESRGCDLRSRGLCLVPIACTEGVANDKQNGADLWSPATNLY